MNILEKLSELHNDGELVGGSTRLIVGPLGITFEMIHSSGDRIQRRLKEDDELGVIRFKEGNVSVVPFFSEIWLNPGDGRFKGIRYTVKTK